MQSVSRLSMRLHRALIEPPPHIQDVALRHKARLLNIFLLPMILIFAGVDGYFLAKFPGYTPPWYGYIFLIGSFLLNRSRFYGLAPFTVLVMFPTVIFANIVFGDAQEPLATLYYLIPGLILAGILLSIRALMVFALVEGLVILSMPRFVPVVFQEFGAVIGPFSALVISAVLVVVAMWFRDQVENDRQAELRESEERLRLALDAAQMGTWTWHIESGAVSWSDEIEQMFGFPKGGFNGRYETYLSLVHPEDLAGVQAAIAHSLAPGGDDYFIEHRLMHRNGAVRWLEARGRVFRSPAGAPLRMTGTVVDITDRKRAEQSLLEQEERFRKVFQTSPVAIVVTTLEEGRIVDANAAYWELSRLSPETALGRTTFELLTGLSFEARARFILELLEKKSIQNSAYDFVDADGEHLNTIAFFELIEVDGQPAILSMFHDLTEQDRARDALRLSETRLRAMLEAVPDMVLEMKRDGMIVHYIPSTANEPSFVPENIVGRKIAEVLPDIAEQIAFAVERVLESGQLHAIEFKRVVNGEPRTFEARLTPTASDQALAMIRDVSLNKWSEAERENLIAELEQKNAELERFTYTVSHDLKSPLITIQGFLGFVREDARMGNLERMERDMARITAATDKMQHLLADLLELSRVGRLKNQSELIATDGLIVEVTGLLHGRLHAGRVRVEVAQNLPPIFGDRQRIFEIFQNLLDNAAKFMGNQPEPLVEIGARGEQDGKAVFYVRDNGKGIAPEYHDQIFGLFNKLDASLEGTGVGLALVKRIVEVHGGRIWVESETGQGSTFFFSLPQAE